MPSTNETPRGDVLVAAPHLNDAVLAALRRRGFHVDRLPAARSVAEALTLRRYAIVLWEPEADDARDSAEVCRELVEDFPLLNVLVVSLTPRLDTALAVLRAGAYDYVTWPMPVEALAIALDRAVQNRMLQREVHRLRRVLNPGIGFEGIIGDSPAMRVLFDLMRRVADSKSTVLITGETGTGKELVARALHKASRRKDGPFVAVNCAALPEPLLESELFGHVRGAFTDAKATRRGLFLEASGGTLFLDELGDMPMALQVKLLRALQDRAVRPVGGNAEVEFDARIITATNRDIDASVAAGTFREDLFYRVNVIHLELPPLRARGGDILLLAEHFLKQACYLAEKALIGIDDEAARRLLEYPWPGNIRELENAVERAVALAGDESISIEDLPVRVTGWAPSHILVAASDPEELVTLKAMEERYVRRVLVAVDGNRTTAARILGIDRKSLYRKMQRFGIAAAGPI